MKLDYHLTGNVAAVTGGGGAIGGAITASLAEQGVSIASWDINLSAAELKATEINSAGGMGIGLNCDVTTKASIESVFEATLKEFLTITFLINSAGGSNKSTTTSTELLFSDLQVDDMAHVFRQNRLTAAILPNQACEKEIRWFGLISGSPAVYKKIHKKGGVANHQVNRFFENPATES
jgi:NAD(P)-dependent dehydrogenase (short-subunit alcohol dehydrogenase family)